MDAALVAVPEPQASAMRAIAERVASETARQWPRLVASERRKGFAGSWTKEHDEVEYGPHPSRLSQVREEFIPTPGWRCVVDGVAAIRREVREADNLGPAWDAKENVAKAACAHLAQGPFAAAAEATVDSIRYQRRRALAVAVNRLYAASLPQLDAFSNACPPGVQCLFQGAPLSVRQYELAKRAAEFADTALAIQDDPIIREVGARYTRARAFLQHFIRTNQITASAREEIDAEQWLDAQRAVWARNQAISDAIVREKQRRTPAQQDSVARVICGLGGYTDKNCPLFERRGQ